MSSNRHEIGKWGFHLSGGYNFKRPLGYCGLGLTLVLNPFEVCISGDVTWFGYYIGWAKDTTKIEYKE